MKSRFTALDIRAIVAELQELVSHGLRVVNVYDVDNKTYLIRLAKPDMKRMLLFESGIRLHSTDFEWPKPTMPSQFSLKCRKHLKSRRLASVQQLGDDRIVDLQFGSDEAAYHMIVELYDRGNVVLTDHQYTILNLLRRRMDNDDVRFAVRETYPVEGARKAEAVSKERLLEIFQAASVGDTIRKLVSPHYVFGPQLMDHCLRAVGLSLSTKVSEEEKLVSDEKQEILFSALSQAEDMMAEVGSSPRGFIIQKERKKPQAAMAAAAAAVAAAEPSGAAASEDVLVAYDEFHPFLFTQHQDLPHREFSTFNQACDEYFSKQEEQKIDVKQHNQEKQAVKKLDNVRKDLKQRVDTLTRGEEDSQLKAGLIEMNIELVESARMILNSELARATDWSDIATMIREAKTRGSATAMAITDLHFERNSFTIALRDPYEALSDVDEDSDDEELDEEQRAAAAKARAKYYVQVGITPRILTWMRHPS